MHPPLASPARALAPAPRRRVWQRGSVRLAAVAVLLVAGVAAAGYALGPYAVIVPGRLERTVKYHGRTPTDLGLRAERFDVEAEPGLWLRGWFIHPSGPARGTVLLMHGHASCKESEFPMAALLTAHGYQCFAYDSRGHGESGGTYCTFGYYEHGDCSRYLDQAGRRFGPLGPVAIHGSSFGGAVALQTMAADRRFCCGVVECTFASLREVVQSDTRKFLHFSWQAPVDTALRRAGEIAHFPPGEVRPEDAAAQIRCPVLLIHGTADERIPIENGERIFHHLTAPGCEWYPVAGAGHGGVWSKDGPEYERRVIAFLDLHMH